MTVLSRALLAGVMACSLSGCIIYKTSSDGITRLRIDETGVVGGPKVTPLRVVSDSRCPPAVQCVWAGEVRIVIRIETGAGAETREIVSDTPVPVADGALTLVEVYPPKRQDQQTYPDEYRFGFRFAGGL